MIKLSALYLLCLILFLGACRQQHKTDIATESLLKTDSSSLSLLITRLEDLPDSLHPRKIFLKDTPSPLSFKIPKTETESYDDVDQDNRIRTLHPPTIHPRAYLQNENGETINDPEGNPYLLGDGGISHFTTYTTDDGLALDNITSSLMDMSGNLWFGTWGGGISKFDGITFTNYTTANGLSNNLVHCLAQDLEGNIWIGTDGSGVSIYDGLSFTNITKNHGLANDLVYDIFADRNGHMWIATGEGGVSKFDGSSFVNYGVENGLPSNYILAISEDKKGNMWFATGNVGVSRFDGTSFTHFTKEDGLAENSINCITSDSSGNLWFGTKDGGVSKYKEDSTLEEKGFFTNYSVYEGLGHNDIWKIKEDGEGNIWLATGGGISKFDGKNFTNYTKAQGLPENRVYTISEDMSGNLWFGTAGGGVTLYHGSAFSNFTVQQGLGENGVYGITEDNKGNFWFGTDGGGVSKYNGKAFTNYTTDQGLSSPLVISILKDKNGHLWFGTGGGGVTLYQEGNEGSQNSSFTTFTSPNGLQNNVIYAMLEDRLGNIWFGTNGGGLVKFDGNITPNDQAGFTSYTTTQGLAGDIVYSLYEDSKNNLWIGTAGGGVSKFDGKSFTNYTTDQGLSNGIVWSILEDKVGNIWFATQGGGVSRFDGQSFSTLTTLEGLVDDTVYDLIEDKAGNIFIGTNRGFTVIPQNFVAFPFSEMQSKLEYYNTAFGYPVKDVNTGIYLDSEGKIWAGNGSDKTALVKFDYQALVKKKKLPAVKIKNIRLNEKIIDWNALSSLDPKDNKTSGTRSIASFGNELRVVKDFISLQERQNLQEEMADVSFSNINRFDNYPIDLILPYSQNQVTLEFGTDELARPNLIEYKYILEGYTKNWSPVLKQTSATFGNIREGDYAFKVMARYTGPSEDHIKNWSEETIYRFSVLPPWYRAWWAYLLYTAIFLVGIRRVHIFQKERTIRKERYLIQTRELEQAKEIEKAYKELKNTQAQLIQSEKMASLGELTAGIAHEIQNPLNFVNNFSEVSSELVNEIEMEVTKKQDERDETLVSELLKDIKSNLVKITQHGKRAEAIVKGMLEHSNSSIAEKEPTDVNTLVTEYLNLTYQSFLSKHAKVGIPPIAITSDLDKSIPKIELVRPDFGKVLLNILNNAFYACTTTSSDLHSSGLKVNMVAYYQADDKFHNPKTPMVTIATKNLGDIIEISIFDNGPGIPEAIREKIFQPFFTTKPPGQGTGLGLSLSYDIVQAHGGELRVDSEENMGTTFYIYLKK